MGWVFSCSLLFSPTFFPRCWSLSTKMTLSLSLLFDLSILLSWTFGMYHDYPITFAYSALKLFINIPHINIFFSVVLLFYTQNPDHTHKNVVILRADFYPKIFSSLLFLHMNKLTCSDDNHRRKMFKRSFLWFKKFLLMRKYNEYEFKMLMS